MSPVVPSRPVLELHDVSVVFRTQHGPLTVVQGVSLHIDETESVGLVGESGSGKTVTALSVMGLLPRRTARIGGGRILLEGTPLPQPGDRAWRQIRGTRIGMVFQDPMTALNPALTIRTQICESLQYHLGMDAFAARAEAVRLLERVGIPHAAERIDDYPHQFSGGMRQRVVIAIALSCKPRLLIADEPTTALDVTVQAQIVGLLDELRRELGMSLLLITHDLGLVATIAQRVIVMYAGRVVEEGPTPSLFARPHHPYTRALLSAVPALDTPFGTTLPVVAGRPPSPADLPPGCRFAPRCPIATAQCREEPVLRESGPGQSVRCWRAFEDAAEGYHAAVR
jgi:oligopeptide/dipeptide ABC transporter ATP-binding protein